MFPRDWVRAINGSAYGGDGVFHLLLRALFGTAGDEVLERLPYSCIITSHTSRGAVLRVSISLFKNDSLATFYGFLTA